MKKRSTRKRWVVKIGSALLTNTETGLNLDTIRRLSSMIARIHRQHIDVVLVSSGSIVEGMQRLGWQTRPREIFKQQAAAAVGQMGLIQAYESEFAEHRLLTAQILLTNTDLGDRTRYLNARSTLRSLLEFNVIPIINENDTVVTEEIQFGDNDTLAALVANLIEAEYMILFTDQDGLFDKNPAVHDDAKLIATGWAGDPALELMAGPGGTLGRGGMTTKVRAAQKAARSGTQTLIANGMRHDVLDSLLVGTACGTLLSARTGRVAARKQWMAGQMRVRGNVTIDQGAIDVLRSKGRSLLPVGVTAVTGQFERGELISCIDEQGKEIARGLINYDSKETIQIKGFSSDKIESVLGYVDDAELIHRDNIVLI